MAISAIPGFGSESVEKEEVASVVVEEAVEGFVREAKTLDCVDREVAVNDNVISLLVVAEEELKGEIREEDEEEELEDIDKDEIT